MQDRQRVTTALALIHQNQVALGKSIQLISTWFKQHAVSEVTGSLQAHMELLVNNSRQINSQLVNLLELPAAADR
ncbi:hypothetical protein D3879_24040 [Pseudomonas cavernicola]|uniref:Uncharacterized protein n=1 Tax=Pseudomonas cavernicola TaxID=2320866 RepID=A0A418X8Y3_9PSED|nr:hypothetical protein [Pseudomonas cavernicola]RJG08921.1 hypothetical protein D3879_24040 [Pseudomonas cavernicola]